MLIKAPKRVRGKTSFSIKVISKIFFPIFLCTIAIALFFLHFCAMGDKNQLIIFDIDSVLDKLEDEIINQESFSSASQSQQQKNESINIPHQNFYNQHENIDVEEKNGNITTSNSSKINDQSLSENNNEGI